MKNSSDRAILYAPGDGVVSLAVKPKVYNFIYITVPDKESGKKNRYTLHAISTTGTKKTTVLGREVTRAQSLSLTAKHIAEFGYTRDAMVVINALPSPAPKKGKKTHAIHRSSQVCSG
jgi:hypothetical protein